MRNNNFVSQKQVTAFRNVHQPEYRPVSRNTVIRRLNLALRQRGEVIRKCREENRYHDVLGDYYLEDAETRRIVMPHVNLEAYAERFQVLNDCEAFTS